MRGMLADSNVLLEGLLYLEALRGMLADSNVLLEGCWDTRKHYERYAG